MDYHPAAETQRVVRDRHHDVQSREVDSLVAACFDAPGQDCLLAGQADLRISKAGAGVDVAVGPSPRSHL